MAFHHHSIHPSFYPAILLSVLPFFCPPIGVCTLCAQFCKLNLVIFSDILTMKVNGRWVPCVCNSSFSFIPILLKIYQCLDHALKICMWFGYNPRLNFLSLFSKRELSHFSDILIMDSGSFCAQLLLHILLKLYKCFDHGLKIFFRHFDNKSEWIVDLCVHNSSF